MRVAMTETSDYPHWREALFGNSHAANLWCAIKYFIWHGAHLLLAAFAVLFYVAVKVGGAINSVLPDSAPNGPNIISPTVEALWLERASRIGRYVWTAFVVVIGIIALAIMAVYAFNNPMTFLAGVGIVVLAIAALAGAVIVSVELEKRFGPKEKTIRTVAVAGEKTVSAAGSAKEKSKNTPLLRRILGYCPVSMDLKPKWFDGLLTRLFGEKPEL